MNTEGDITVVVKNAVKRYGEHIVLNNVSLELRRGTIYGIVGQNGSGKTVLFKCICGFTKLTEGTVEVMGKIIGKDVDIAQSVGAIIENPGFLPNYSAYKNLKFLASLTDKIGDKEILSSIEKVGLNSKDRKKVGKFSMGMRQRLGIAQAIMENPDILILDEPFNGLDKNGVTHMRNLLLEQKRIGRTVLLASHNSMDIDILCDEVYEMESGKICRLH